MAGQHGKDLALAMLRTLPRVSLSNIRNNPGSRMQSKRGRGQHGGDKHGAGNKGSGQRQNYMRPGYETGSTPLYIKVGREPYYKGHHLKLECPPLSMYRLQKFIDTNRLDTSRPIDLVSLLNTDLINFKTEWKHAGIQMTDRGADKFKAKINLEVQWATEPVIAAIERNGGTITTAYYDMHCVLALQNVNKFFSSGEPIPRRMLPPRDYIEYYSSAKNRGYLADPEEISYERLVLSQKYGYELPKIENDPQYEMLIQRKDPRQLFYGLEPGWIISLKDQAILKPKAEYLKQFYSS